MKTTFGIILLMIIMDDNYSIRMTNKLSNGRQCLKKKWLPQSMNDFTVIT